MLVRLAARLAIVFASATSGMVLAYQDPLSQPAETSPLAPRTSLMAATRAGDRLVVVGQRGVILYGEVKAENAWRQAAVPVSADLTGVAFPTAKNGWAVGHGGVVLHTDDTGATWVRQVDGKTLGEAALVYYKAQSGPGSEGLTKRGERLADEGVSEPLLDVWFRDEKTGYVVGTFNRVFRTDDGGAHWTPLVDRTDNPEELHFYAVRGAGDDVFLAGERGMVWRWDHAKARFISIPTPYTGSLFGLLVTPQAVFAFGMRGHLFRTTDRGGHWESIETGLRAGIVAGSVSSDGTIVLAAQSGDILHSVDGGQTFKPLPLKHRSVVAGVMADGKRLVLVGPAGVRVETVDR